MNLVLVMQITDGSDTYNLVNDNDTGEFFLHALTVQKHCDVKLDPDAVKGLCILFEQGHEDCVLAILRAMVPE